MPLERVPGNGILPGACRTRATPANSQAYGYCIDIGMLRWLTPQWPPHQRQIVFTRRSFSAGLRDLVRWLGRLPPSNGQKRRPRFLLPPHDPNWYVKRLLHTMPFSSTHTIRQMKILPLVVDGSCFVLFIWSSDILPEATPFATLFVFLPYNDPNG